MTRKEIYAWMDKQIEAAEILNIPVNVEDNYYICIAGVTPKKIHIYGIDNLCRELHKPYRVEEEYIGDWECHYFKYRGYKFFGLVKR